MEKFPFSQGVFWGINKRLYVVNLVILVKPDLYLTTDVKVVM